MSRWIYVNVEIRVQSISFRKKSAEEIVSVWLPFTIDSYTAFVQKGLLLLALM